MLYDPGAERSLLLLYIEPLCFYDLTLGHMFDQKSLY